VLLKEASHRGGGAEGCPSSKAHEERVKRNPRRGREGGDKKGLQGGGGGIKCRQKS